MIRLHKSADQQFYFVVVARNGRTLITSETYKKKENALKGIYSMAEVIASSCGLDKKVEDIVIDDCSKVKN